MYANQILVSKVVVWQGVLTSLLEIDIVYCFLYLFRYADWVILIFLSHIFNSFKHGMIWWASRHKMKKTLLLPTTSNWKWKSQQCDFFNISLIFLQNVPAKTLTCNRMFGIVTTTVFDFFSGKKKGSDHCNVIWVSPYLSTHTMY